jgi:hypothetical protein
MQYKKFDQDEDMDEGDDDDDDDDDDGEEEDDDEEAAAYREAMRAGRPYVPPANDRDGPKPSFGEQCDRQFIVPTRLHDKPYELIEAANDWHYAMMNDHPRNEFYRDALRGVVTSNSVVLEIGAGSGLLSIIAATLGAKCIIAIEANRHLADVATEIIKRNGHQGRIHIINKMSTDVTRDEILQYGDPDILLSEILGTLLLGESALHYVYRLVEYVQPSLLGGSAPSARPVPLKGAGRSYAPQSAA